MFNPDAGKTIYQSPEINNLEAQYNRANKLINICLNH